MKTDTKIHRDFERIRRVRECVLEDAIEYDRNQESGKETTKNLESILLNGNNICMIVPGGRGVDLKELKRSDLEELELQHVGVQHSEYNLPSEGTIWNDHYLRLCRENRLVFAFLFAKSSSSSRVVF